jgi:hypothetical protein
MRKYFLIIISYITKMMMIHPKKFKKMLVNQQVAKTPQAIFMGIRFIAVIPKTQNKQIAVLE